MKKIYMVLLICCIAITTQAQQAYLDEGSPVEEYPKVEWLKGEPITHFDKSKIYVIDLWATWCLPCIAAMPHLNELNLKFKDKNVVFVAQDVMEADKEKVNTFIRQKGDNLSFSMAYGGMEGSEFYVKWIKAAGISSIPQTFIIQNNTLVWQTTPNMLNEEVLQLLVDGKFTIPAAKAIAKRHQ